ncbi:hypothetical protein [Qipengyuania sp. JC766]|uniref:hypothetical protein n=1 Tax=Qipengyuania sp. JC766 TaxID=3232139 RepID=UPI00345AA4D7
MPFDPKADKIDDRTFALNSLWLGFASSLLFLAGLLAGWEVFLVKLAGALASAAPVSLLFVRFFDDYQTRLVSHGARWASVVVGIWLLAQLLSDTSARLVAEIDPMLGLAICVVAFHAGIASARIRGTVS